MKKIIRSKYLFDGIHPPQKGYVLIVNELVEQIAFDWNYQKLVTENTEVLRYDEYFVMPGLHDNHVFFSGYLRMHAGVDLAECKNEQEILTLIKAAIKKSENSQQSIYAHGIDLEKWSKKPLETLLEQINYPGAITAIDKGRSYCWMNQKAKERYGFNEKQTGAEDQQKLIKELLANHDQLNSRYQQFEQLMFSRGVVSIKEIVFDTAEYFEKLPDRKLQTNFYIQSVAEPLDIERLISYKNIKFPHNINFGGAKIMVDGVVADESGDTFGGYSSGETQPDIDYTMIRKLVVRCNEAGIPCCLTTEGDEAAVKSARILAEGSKRLPEGMFNSISDLEMIEKEAAQIMAENHIVAEIYPQILGLNSSYEESYMLEILPEKYQDRFFNYQILEDKGVKITSGTDLPLFITNLPESVIRSVLREFPNGEKKWNLEQRISMVTLLQSFTKNAFEANGITNSGTLSPGNKADLVVFDGNLEIQDSSKLAEMKVFATYIDGEIVYQKE